MPIVWYCTFLLAKDMSGLCTNSIKNIQRSWEPGCEGPKCPVKLNQCLPGLMCNESTGVCSMPPPLQQDSCTQECMYKKSLKRLGEYHWDPDCEEDGSYSPKQCKGTNIY